MELCKKTQGTNNMSEIVFSTVQLSNACRTLQGNVGARVTTFDRRDSVSLLLNSRTRGDRFLHDSQSITVHPESSSRMF